MAVVIEITSSECARYPVSSVIIAAHDEFFQGLYTDAFIIHKSQLGFEVDIAYEDGETQEYTAAYDTLDEALRDLQEDGYEFDITKQIAQRISTLGYACTPEFYEVNPYKHGYLPILRRIYPISSYF